MKVLKIHVNSYYSECFIHRMNIIKTDLRNLLTTKSLNSLMWLSMSNKDKWTFDFSRAVTRYFRNHRRCDDRGGKNKILGIPEDEQDIIQRINQLQKNIIFHRNNIAIMETELSYFQEELRKDSAELESLKQRLN